MKKLFTIFLGIVLILPLYPQEAGFEPYDDEIGDETSEVIRVPKKEVMNYITAPAQRYRFQKILEFNGKVFYSSYITKPEFKVLTDRCV